MYFFAPLRLYERIFLLLMKRHKLLKILFAACLLLALLAALAWLFPQQVLTVDSGPVKGDVLVLLGGRPDRAFRAAELFKQGAAPKVLVTGLGDDASNKRTLEQNGVTNTAIIMESKSHTTRENAEFSIAILRKMGAKRVILVTSWYHSRRSLATFEHYAPDIQFYSRPSYVGYQRPDWHPNGLSHYIKSEYVKLLGYWVCYGVCPI